MTVEYRPDPEWVALGQRLNHLEDLLQRNLDQAISTGMVADAILGHLKHFEKQLTRARDTRRD